MKPLPLALALILLSNPLFVPAQDMSQAGAPVQTVSMVWVFLFVTLFIGTIVWFFLYMWYLERKKEQNQLEK